MALKIIVVLILISSPPRAFSSFVAGDSFMPRVQQTNLLAIAQVRAANYPPFLARTAVCVLRNARYLIAAPSVDPHARYSSSTYFGRLLQ